MSAIDLGTWSLGADAGRVAERFRRWDEDGVPGRIWRSDPTVWSAATADDVATRTGWLGLPTSMAAEVEGLRAFAKEVREEGFRHVVVLGMGGSSLAPDVFRRVFGSRPGHPELIVLDSTHPAAVAAVAARLEIPKTFFLVSSKSGTTTEPLDFHRYFWEAVRATGRAPGPQFAAITDAGSPLDRLAQSEGFRAVFRALATVGGRYSALTLFGLVPAALIGVDLDLLLSRAQEMATECGPAVPTAENPGLALGAVIGELAAHGRDKLTFYAAHELLPFPIWAEQLVAESTGKIGRGIVPVVDEAFVEPERYGADRLFVELQPAGAPDPTLAAHTARLERAGHPVVRLTVRDRDDLGAEFFRWELAVASAGAIVGIDPFDQPDVELAKQLAREAMASGGGAATPADVPEVLAVDASALRAAIGPWLASTGPGDYVAIQAYLAPRPEVEEALEAIRRALLERLRLATTFGYGPRFLHSTGQLHKGGPPTGIFLQIVDRPAPDVEVPGAGYTFGRLIQAQAVGDDRALRQKGRRIVRVDLGQDPLGGLRRLDEAVRA